MDASRNCPRMQRASSFELRVKVGGGCGGGAGVPRWGRARPQCHAHPSGAGLSPEFPEFGNQDSIERWKHPELEPGGYSSGWSCAGNILFDLRRVTSPSALEAVLCRKIGWTTCPPLFLLALALIFKAHERTMLASPFPPSNSPPHPSPVPPSYPLETVW